MEPAGLLSSSKVAHPLRPDVMKIDSLEKNGELMVLTTYSNEIWTATVGSDVVQSGRPIFDDFFQHLWPYIGNNTANVALQMIKRLWLIRIDQ
ncbi:hypothetical protein TNCV_2009831 [Trichonephila clavipes]|nr:hypothetical protein TNCV_2009831 [Trichonephila clavipes]